MIPKRYIQAVVGALTFVALFWFLRSTQVFGWALAPAPADGSVKGDPVSWAIVVDAIVSFLAAVGSYVIFGAKWLMQLLGQYIIDDGDVAPAPAPVESGGNATAAEMMQSAIGSPMPPAQQAAIMRAIQQAIYEGDHESLKTGAETLHGKPFFPPAKGGAA